MSKKIRYRVKVISNTPQQLEVFVQWIINEHGEELLAVSGCLEYRVFQISPLEAHCEYLFKDADSLQAYYQNEAPKLREKSSAKFPASTMRFSRDESSLIASGTRY